MKVLMRLLFILLPAAAIGIVAGFLLSDQAAGIFMFSMAAYLGLCCTKARPERGEGDG